MNNAGIGVKSIDDRMVTTVSLVMTQLWQVRRWGRRGQQHKVWWRRAIITVRKHDVHQQQQYISELSYHRVCCRRRGPNLTAPARLLQTLFTPGQAGTGNRSVLSIHLMSLLSLPLPLLPPSNYNYPSACYSSTDSSTPAPSSLIMKAN